MMFDTLIESRRRKDRRSGGTTVSVVLHAVLIVLAVVMTAEAKDPPAHTPPPPEIIYRAVVKLTEQPKPVTRTHAAVEMPRTAHIVRDVVLPPTIPTTLPPIDPTAPVVDPRDFNGVGVPEGAVNDAGGAPDGGGVYYAFQVEKQTVPIDGNPKPQYPSMLESARVDGLVLVQFVVDTTGRVDMSTFKVLEATNELFVDAVKRVLPSWRFYPAEAGGRKVPQLVQMPLVFKVP
ncbi:MAG TPA: energy transducer TonB [Gemmatimonadaceae bacterium]|nr:energy transducer TonB [Gemmatimonadaceae bacterium]